MLRDAEWPSIYQSMFNIPEERHMLPVFLLVDEVPSNHSRNSIEIILHYHFTTQAIGA
jgi:hypothetical protein